MICENCEWSMPDGKRVVLKAELEKYADESEHVCLEIIVDGRLIVRSTMPSSDWFFDAINNQWKEMRAMPGQKFSYETADMLERFLCKITDRADAELASKTLSAAGKIRLVIETSESWYIRLESNYYNKVLDADTLTEEFVLEQCRKMSKGRKTEFVVKKYFADADIANSEAFEVIRVRV